MFKLKTPRGTYIIPDQRQVYILELAYTEESESVLPKLIELHERKHAEDLYGFTFIGEADSHVRDIIIRMRMYARNGKYSFEPAPGQYLKPIYLVKFEGGRADGTVITTNDLPFRLIAPILSASGYEMEAYARTHRIREGFEVYRFCASG